jgi:hypothetical protein
MVPDTDNETTQVASLDSAAIANRFLKDPTAIERVLAGLK